MLVRLKMPLAVGVIRQVAGKSFDERLDEQIRALREQSKFKSVDDLLCSGETYVVE